VVKPACRPAPAEKEGPRWRSPTGSKTTDGVPADPPTFTTVAPTWRPGDTIPLGKRALQVVGIRATGIDETPVLIVEDAIDPFVSPDGFPAWRSWTSAQGRREGDDA
jgi:hypothetical protein